MRVPFGPCLHPGVLAIGKTMDRSRKDNVTPEQMARFLELALGDAGDTAEAKKKIVDWMGVTERAYRSYINEGVCAKKDRVQKALDGLARELTRDFNGCFTRSVYVGYCKYVFEGIGGREELIGRLQTASIIVDALFLAKRYALMDGKTKKMVDDMFLMIAKGGLSRRRYEYVLAKEPDSHCEVNIEPDVRATRAERAVEMCLNDCIEGQYKLEMSDEDFAKYS